MGATGISLLGPLSVAPDDGGVAVSLGPRDRVVLAVLATRPREAVSVERLADALWGEHPPPSGNKVVAGCVMRLRRVLGADAIETTTHGYRLKIRANGDSLTITAHDVACPTGPMQFGGTGTWVVTGGTGRFSDATGSGTITGGANFVTQKFTFEMSGTITAPGA